MEEEIISRHVGADGTLVPANASFKSFVSIEVAMDPEQSSSHASTDKAARVAHRLSQQCGKKIAELLGEGENFMG